MKAKDKDTLRSMDPAKLQAEATKLRQEMAKLQLDMRMKQAKDTNMVAKNKRRLAVIETFLNQKKTS
jgi:ribosomal protein L29